MSFLSPLALRARRADPPAGAALLPEGAPPRAPGVEPPALEHRRSATARPRPSSSGSSATPCIILQILALLVLATALARPVADGHGPWRAQGRGGARHLGVDEGPRRRRPSRFDAGRRRRPRSLVAGLGEGAEVMVIESGVQPKVAAALGRDRDRALGAIASAQARDLPNRVAEAVRTARALVGATTRRPRSTSSPTGSVRWATSRTSTIRASGGSASGAAAGTSASPTSAVRKNYYGAFDYQAFVSLVNYTAETQDFTFSPGPRRQADRREVGDAGAERPPLGGAAVQPHRRRHGDRAAPDRATTSPPTTPRTRCCRRRGRSRSSW